MAAFPLRMVYMKVGEENPESSESAEHSENSELSSSSAPPVMLLAVMIRFGFWNVNAILILALVGLWSLRLTTNWLSVYK